MNASGIRTVQCNVGCGQNPTDGWRNFDNSLSLRLARVPLLPRLLSYTGLIDVHQLEYIEFALAHRLEYADAASLPLADGTVDALYTSHMLEHLDRGEAARFIAEANRVLRPGGIIRIAVPDIRKQVDAYLATRDADAFIEGTHLTQPRPKTLFQRLRVLLVGTRHHQWMYDGESLSKELLAGGFKDSRVLPAGETSIAAPGKLDLSERADESVYVEAVKS